MKQLVVEIKPDGSILVHAQGYSGPSCETDVKALLDELGLNIEEEEHLPSFYYNEPERSVLQGERS